MNPETGVRFELCLLRAGDAVSYSCRVQSPEASMSTRAEVDVGSGEVTFAGDQELPSSVKSTIRGVLRGLWRSRNGEKGSPWPRRLTRWRAAQR